MKLLLKICAIGIFSLLIGIFFNQVVFDGIPLNLLIASIPTKTDSATLNYMTADDAKALLHHQHVKFIDVRPPVEFEIDHIANAISIPYIDFLRNPSLLDTMSKQDTLIFYGFDPEDKESATMATMCMNQGFPNILLIHGGFAEWLEKEYPITR